VRGHNRVAADLYGEDLSQLQQAILDPATPVLVGAARECILAAQEGTAHAAGDTVVESRGNRAQSRHVGRFPVHNGLTTGD